MLPNWINFAKSGHTGDKVGMGNSDCVRERNGECDKAGCEQLRYLGRPFGDVIFFWNGFLLLAEVDSNDKRKLIEVKRESEIAHSHSQSHSFPFLNKSLSLSFYFRKLFVFQFQSLSFSFFFFLSLFLFLFLGHFFSLPLSFSFFLSFISSLSLSFFIFHSLSLSFKKWAKPCPFFGFFTMQRQI